MTSTTAIEVTAEILGNRRKAVDHLRTTALPQGFGALYSRRKKCYCALGHIGLAVGIDAKEYPAPPYAEIADAVGMDGFLSRTIEHMNDGTANEGDVEKTLPEIGDFLAGVWGIA